MELQLCSDLFLSFSCSYRIKHKINGLLRTGARYNTERLMRTELARVQTEAQETAFKAQGFKRYQFIVNGGCCDICKAIAKKNGGIYKVSEMQYGYNAPPVHPHCRCSTAAYEDNAEYEAWLDFLSKGGTTEQWNDEKKPIGYPNTKSVNIAGMDIIKNTQIYSFGDGAGGIKKVINADIYTTPEGTRFVFPKGYDKKKQTMTPEKAIELWNKVPEKMRRQAQKTVEFVDYYNPQDSYWRRVYKNFVHSYATGGEQITFYRYDYPHDDDYVVRTYCHEIGHYIDCNIATKGYRFSNEKLWMDAMVSDERISGYSSPTLYGENAAVEDFAESIAEYIADNAGFKAKFPGRYSILKNIVV